MNSQLTRRQAQVLELIRQSIVQSGVPPTRAELVKALGVSSANGVEEHLRALARKGVIEIVRGAARGLRIVGGTGIPVIGRVAAGSPILAEESIERRLELNPSFFSPSADYFLKVRGESMVGAGILDGDLVAVHRTTDVLKNQIVVARLDNEVTVKRYRPVRGGVWLMPENPEMDPIWIHAGDRQFTIEGLVVGVIRIGTP